MKIFNKVSIVISTIAFVFSFTLPVAVFAATTATTPTLGAAATYGVLSDTYTNPSGPTTINGDVGFTTGPAVMPLGGHPSITYPNYGSGAPYSSAGADQATALAALNGGTNAACDFTFAPGSIDLATDTTHGPLGIYVPGVYCTAGAASVLSVGTAGITLNGAGTYIFRNDGALNTVTGSSVALTNGASACDVFWTPNGATTLNHDSTFTGTVIPVLAASDDITVYDGVQWLGRALTFGHTVTTPGADAVITVPTCTPPPTTETINVVKVVVGGTKVVSDFPLFVNGSSVVSGVTNSFAAPATYTVTETSDPNYSTTFSGFCPGGIVNLTIGNPTICTITNTYITPPQVIQGGGGGQLVSPLVPPLIDVVKTASPLSLPNGPGPVTYTYTLRNIGTVPVTNVTMVGDTCSPIIRVSGDTNGDNKLDVSETWVYSCSTALSTTHTNTVTATGWANGISAVDVASATVVVGVPGLPNTGIVPPLIHITKIPSPLALGVGGGVVTYTEKITNPGAVALSNVKLTDDKCSPLNYISGDANNDSKLDINETWIYTCQINLSKTTTNTAVASGDANGLSAKDFAIATVVVAVPKLPNTGLPPEGESTPWTTILIAGILGIVSASLLVFLKKDRI